MENKLFSNKDLKKLIWPLIVEQILGISVGMIDLIMIASVGEAAISGVSLVDNIGILIIQVFAALATGGAVVAGHYLGEKNKEKACFAGEQLILFTVILSVAVTAFMYIGKGFIFNNIFGKIEPDVMGYAETYLMIVSLSIPFIAVYNSCAALFRSMGNSKISMSIALLMNALNIGGNAITIYYLKMGVAGAAISTLISRLVAAVVIFLLLRNPKNVIHLKKSFRIKFDWHLIKKILYIGIPNGLENSMFQLGKIMVLSLVTTFGTIAITANAVANSVALFQILPGIAIGHAMITVISRCVGAKDYEQARYYTVKLTKLTYICILAANALVLAALPLIIKVYNLSGDTSSVVTQIVIFYSLISFVLWPAAFSIPNTLRAANDVKFSMYISIFSMWMFRIVFSYILGKYLGFGVLGVWMAMGFDWLFRGICFIIRYRKGKWEYMKV